MKVYVVVGGWEYEPVDYPSMKVFTRLSDAESYKIELEGMLLGDLYPYYDFASIKASVLYQ
jgi:hypothetical protein